MTKLSHAFLLLLLLLPASPALAGEFNTIINGKSFHLGSDENWNEKNYGLGFEYHLESQTRWKWLLMANGFRDSVKNMSYMAGGGLHRNVYSTNRLNGLYVDVGLNAFMMTRKDIDEGRPFPGMLPSVAIGNRVMGVNLSYLPKTAVKKFAKTNTMDNGMRGIVYLQLKVNLTALLGIERRVTWRYN